MNSFAAEAPDRDFLVPLQRARALYMFRAMALTVLWSVAAALLVLKLAGLRPETMAAQGLLALTVLVGALGAGLLVTFRARPSLKLLARRADRRFGLAERLSTAISVPRTASGWSGTMSEGLQYDAAQRAGAVVPHRLMPLATWSLACAAFALVVAIGVGLLLPNALPDSSTAQPQASAVAPVDAATRSENLRTLANAIDADAKGRQDDYLQAVADAVSKLAETPAADLTDAQFNDALTGLLDHARLAYGKALPAWMRGDAASPADPFHLARDSSFAALAQSAIGQSDDGRAGGGEEMVPELLGERNLLPDVQRPNASGQIKVTRQEGDLGVNNQGVGGDANTANSVAGSQPSAAAGGTPSLGETDPASLGDINGGAGIPLGGASQSSAGASRVAGAGTQSLEDPSRNVASVPEAKEEVLLPADSYRQGKRIRIEVTPPASGNILADGAGDAVALTSDGRQTPVARGIPSVRDQAVFARYFTHGEAP